jgi:hypothetical protein
VRPLAASEVGEFARLDLRSHSLLADVPLHDVWRFELAGGGADRSMSDVIALSASLEARPNPLVRALFGLRWAVGRRLGWDRERPEQAPESYVHRLDDADRARSLVVPGTRQGAFRMVFVFPREALAEVRNATVHGFLASALTPRPGGYFVYWAIYVKPVGPLTGLYMAMIDPFRRLLVYPALIRELQAAWAREYA